MRLLNVFLLLFLLTAFSIGVKLYENGVDIEIIDISFHKAISNVENITLETDVNNTYYDGLYLILEKYIHFVGVAGLEGMRMGTLYGYENPEYFSADFIIKIVKIILWIIIISLLIKPVGFLIVFIILGIIALKDKIKNDRRKRNK